ncbi:MAG: class I SAM-dependent methyltransferase [Coriobacteriales bacterium]|jgi:23S rRNA (guanine2445-N2)-methyltransferase / 23S rRNA (guanine2069-N7)-methyltransferase|nr:class I SAM-dependent methyltransferase [Coriobacteriales bacterium]
MNHPNSTEKYPSATENNSDGMDKEPDGMNKYLDDTDKPASDTVNPASDTEKHPSGTDRHPHFAEKREFFVSCAKGLEACVADELRALGVRKPRPLVSGVSFQGSLKVALRACLWLRCASRVLLVLGRLPANSAEALYNAARSIPWEEHLSPTQTFAIAAQGKSTQFKDSRFASLKVKDALVDRLRDIHGSRPNVQTDQPDLQLRLALREGRATLYLDLSGEPLHRRAYRVPDKHIAAPLRETLAAAMLLSSGWPKQGPAEHYGFLLDPLCGSGTIGIEAALIEADRAPGLLREYWGFSAWLQHQPDIWEDLLDEADERAEKAMAATHRPILLRDIDGKATQVATASARRAGVLELLDIQVADVTNVADATGAWSVVADAAQSAQLGRGRQLAQAVQVAQPAQAAPSGGNNWKSSLGRQPAHAAPAEQEPQLAQAVQVTQPTQSVQEKQIVRTAQLAQSGQADQAVQAPQAARPVGGSRGLLITNPPYGERMDSRTQLPSLYAGLAERVQDMGISGACIISSDDLLEAFVDRALGAAPVRRLETFNGPLEVKIRIWGQSESEELSRQVADTGSIGDADSDAAKAMRYPDNVTGAGSSGSFSGPNVEDIPGASGTADTFEVLDLTGIHGTPSSVRQILARPPDTPDIPDARHPTTHLDSTDFVNRLAKMARHHGKWARRSNVSCYRVYDADLPDFNVVIDLYQGADGTSDEGKRWLHIAEYQAPSDIDPGLANQRLSAVLLQAPRVLEVPSNAVFLKRRMQSRGGSQYSGAAGKSVCQTIKEGGLLFEIDLSQRLDTGIFLDHRITRQLLRDGAAGRDCLNLFAYTGTASVYMAAGGARSVTTVDLSQTYLSWAKRNFALNRLDSRHPFIQADVLSWVSENRHAKQKYGLIFCDVPTFSNSTSMGRRTWDAQRDHAELLIALSRMLTPDGKIYFSTNLRKFKPDLETLVKAGVQLTDITPETIPPDFQRRKDIHHCYSLTRKL